MAIRNDRQSVAHLKLDKGRFRPTDRFDSRVRELRWYDDKRAFRHPIRAVFRSQLGFPFDNVHKQFSSSRSRVHIDGRPDRTPTHCTRAAVLRLTSGCARNSARNVGSEAVELVETDVK